MESGIRVGDMSITDEHAVVKESDDFRIIAKKLIRYPTGAVVVLNTAGRVSGVLTIKELLKAMIDDKKPSKTRAKELMKTNILEINENESLENTIRLMQQSHPDGVVIVGPQGQLKGYFSPDDYREASIRIEQAQQMMDRLGATRSALEGMTQPGSGSNDDILAQLLGAPDQG